MNWYKKSYNKEIGYLNRYLKTGFDPWNYLYLVPDFLEEFYPQEIEEMENNNDINNSNLFQEKNLYHSSPDYFSEKWIERAKPEELEKFKNWVQKKDLDPTRPSASPSEIMSYEKFIKPTWLIHFTNNPDSISYGGFQKGWEDIEGLAYTSFYKTPDYPGYNFAFRADNYRDIRAAARENKYGTDAVLFWGSGVEATHYGDNEAQVIVWGPSVKPELIIPIYKLDNGAWGIEREGVEEAYPIVENEDITEVIDWVIDNITMVRQVLEKWKPKRKKKQIAKLKSWYKIAQSPIVQFLSYNSYGNLKILINGKPYTYYEVSPTIKDKIEWMINNPKIPRGVILNQLKPFSNPKRHQELNSPMSKKEKPIQKGLFNELV